MAGDVFERLRERVKPERTANQKRMCRNAHDRPVLVRLLQQSIDKRLLDVTELVGCDMRAVEQGEVVEFHGIGMEIILPFGTLSGTGWSSWKRSQT